MPQRDQLWDGKERRIQFKDDHDCIIVFGVKIDEHSNAIKTLANNHNDDYKIFIKKDEDTNRRIDWLFRIVWIGSGIGATIQFFIMFLK